MYTIIIAAIGADYNKKSRRILITAGDIRRLNLYACPLSTAFFE
jgi:hypothetical protein